jgi:hypothetical protein
LAGSVEITATCALAELLLSEWARRRMPNNNRAMATQTTASTGDNLGRRRTPGLGNERALAMGPKFSPSRGGRTAGTAS